MFNIPNLKESNTFLLTLLDTITSAVFLIDDDIKVRSFNNSFKALFNQDENAINQLCGNALGCVFAIKENAPCGSTAHCGNCILRKSLLSNLAKNTPTDKVILEREFFINNKFVNKILQYSTRKLIFNKKEVIIVIVDDITKLEFENRKIESQNKELHLINSKLKTEQDKTIKLERDNAVLSLGVTANHELNQPLSIASMNIELFKMTFQKNILNDKQNILLTRTQNALTKMTTIISKYADTTKQFHFGEYTKGVEMVIFDKEEKDKKDD